MSLPSVLRVLVWADRFPRLTNPGVQYNKEYNFSMEPSGFVIPVYTSMGYSYKQQQLFHKNKIQLTKENESPTTL